MSGQTHIGHWVCQCVLYRLGRLVHATLISVQMDDRPQPKSEKPGNELHLMCHNPPFEKALVKTTNQLSRAVIPPIV